MTQMSETADEAAGTTTRRSKSVTRANILQAAFEMYMGRELERGNERLASVVDRLGYTTGAAYQIWPNQAAFRHDLSVYVAENIEYASLRGLTAKIVELAAMNLPFEQHALAAGDLFIDSFLGREEFYLKLRFVEMKDDRPAEITSALRGAYDQSAWEAGQLISLGLERFQRRICEPLELSLLTGAVTAALEGYALRHRLQPEHVVAAPSKYGAPHYVFSLVFLAILKDFTEPVPQ